MDSFIEQTAPGTAYAEIKKMIKLKQLKPGQRLAEVALSKEIGVSRTPLREAMRKLTTEGWLHMIPNSGVWVASPTKREISDAYSVRTKLEQWGIKEAVINATPLLFRRLEEIIDDEQALYDGKINAENYSDINKSFHLCIAEAGGNSVLYDHIKLAITRTEIYLVLYDNYLDFPNTKSIAGHRELLSLLKAKNAEKAVEKIGLHIEDGFGDLDLTSVVAYR